MRPYAPAFRPYAKPGRREGKGSQRVKVFLDKLSLSDRLHSRTSLTRPAGKWRNFVILIFTLVLGFLTQSSYAVPVGGEVIMSGIESFDTDYSYEPKRLTNRCRANI